MKNPLTPIKAIIKDVRPEAEGVKTYTLSTEFPFLAEPGQFNMVGYPGVGEAPISLSAIMQDGSFKHTIKSVGRVTDFLKDFKKGDELFFRGPMAGAGLLRRQRRRMFSSLQEVGLAPLKPVIQIILDQRGSFGNVSLICGARNEKNMLFMDEFDGWAEKTAVYLTVDEAVQPDRWKHHVGLVTDLLDRVKIKPEKGHCFCLRARDNDAFYMQGGL